MQVYICYWHEYRMSEVHTIEYFTEDLGFDADDIQEIKNMKHDDVWLGSNIQIWCREE